MRSLKLAAAFGALATVALALPAAAQTVISEEELKEDLSLGRFGGSVSTGVIVGTGTFVSDEFSDDPLVVQQLGLAATMRIEEIPGTGTLSLGQAFSLEYTDPGNSTGRQWDYGDTSLALSAPMLWKESVTGISVGASLSASLPISFVSRFQEKITTVGAGVNAMRGFGDFTLQAGFSAAKNFYVNKTLGISAEDLEDSSGISCEGECRGGGYLVNWGLSTFLGGGYRITDKLSASLNLFWSGGFKFAAPDDTYTSKNAVGGTTGTMDFVGTRLGLAYSIDRHFTVTAGASTNHPLRSADNKSYRLLFWDTKTLANNYSGLSVGAQAIF